MTELSIDFVAAERVATFLERHGIDAGDRVGVMLPPTPVLGVVSHGILRRGAVAVPLNPRLKSLDVVSSLRETGAQALFGTPTDPRAASAATVAASVVGTHFWLVDEDELPFLIADVPAPQTPVRC